MTERLDEIWSGERTPDVYRWTLPLSTMAICEQASRHGWRCFHLDGSTVGTKGEFLQACAKAMRFPEYVGHNWDALEESVRDLSWAPARSGYLLIYTDAGRFARAHPEDFAVALSILRSAVRHWRATSTPLAILLSGLGQMGREIHEL